LSGDEQYNTKQTPLALLFCVEKCVVLRNYLILGENNRNCYAVQWLALRVLDFSHKGQKKQKILSIL